MTSSLSAAERLFQSPAFSLMLFVQCVSTCSQALSCCRNLQLFAFTWNRPEPRNWSRISLPDHSLTTGPLYLLNLTSDKYPTGESSITNLHYHLLHIKDCYYLCILILPSALLHRLLALESTTIYPCTGLVYPVYVICCPYHLLPYMITNLSAFYLLPSTTLLNITIKCLSLLSLLTPVPSAHHLHTVIYIPSLQEHLIECVYICMLKQTGPQWWVWRVGSGIPTHLYMTTEVEYFCSYKSTLYIKRMSVTPTRQWSKT